jgi:hypothetical protein
VFLLPNFTQLKKAIPFTITIILTIIAFTGCSCSRIGDLVIDIRGETDKSEELLKYLSEDDVDGLKSMFCTAISVSSDFDGQIQAAMDFFDGKVVSYDSIQSGGVDKLIENGRTVRLAANPRITGIKADSDEEYEIKFYSYLINDARPDIVGISKLIIIKNSNGKECVVGELK